MKRINRPGFTLLELLAVIGILLILISLAILGYSHVDAAATTKATITYLENAKALIVEYEVSAPITTQRAALPPPQVGPGPIVGGLLDPSGAGTVTTFGEPAVPSIAAPGDVNPGSPTRYLPATLAMTETIMQQLARVPNNSRVLAQLPGKQIMLDANSQPMTYNGKATTVMLDGWKNPIIYVPAGGLSGVTINGGKTGPQVKTVIAVDGRPFFASAGQDGNFANGDDNLYSSQVRYVP
jgi:prepilin-type N-terminal cleavage/methylation domain-containing protein